MTLTRIPQLKTLGAGTQIVNDHGAARDGSLRTLNAQSCTFDTLHFDSEMSEGLLDISGNGSHGCSCDRETHPALELSELPSSSTSVDTQLHESELTSSISTKPKMIGGVP